MTNLLCSSFLWEKFSFPWSILSFFRSGLPKPHCVRFWQPSRSQKRKNWSRKRKSFSQKRNCACELCHFSATLFQLLRRYIPLPSSPKRTIVESTFHYPPLLEVSKRGRQFYVIGRMTWKSKQTNKRVLSEKKNSYLWARIARAPRSKA